MTHDTALVSTRLDPIMNPGDVSSHVHAVMGASNFGPTYDYDKSLESSQVTPSQVRDRISS